MDGLISAIRYTIRITSLVLYCHLQMDIYAATLIIINTSSLSISSFSSNFDYYSPCKSL